MGTSLEEIFTDDAKAPEPKATETPAAKEPEPALEPDETPEPKAEAADPEPEKIDEPDADGAEPAKAEEPEPKADEPKMVPHAALHEARERARKADERYNELAGQVGQLLPHLKNVGQPPTKDGEGDKPKLNFYDDPAAFVTQGLTDLEGRLNGLLGSVVMTMSENQARARYDDYDDMLSVFEDLAKEHPMLKQQVRQQPNPAEWAYQVAKTHKAAEEIGDPAEFEKRLREKWEAEQAQQAEQGAQQTEEKTVPNLPKSLATARNVGTGKRTSGPGWQGPTPLNDALAGVPGRAQK